MTAFSMLRSMGVLLISCALSSACTETEYLSHLWKKGSKSYGDDQYRYDNHDGVVAAAQNNIGNSDRPQQEGLYKVGKPYQALGRWYTPTESYSYDETGIASWYGPGFHGKSTANGEPYDSYAMTAAHPTLQMPSVARVTNLDNGRSVVVRINDRGPFKRGRIIDVSKRAAELLGMISTGTAKVRVQVLERESRIAAEAARNGLPPHVQMAMAFKRPASDGTQIASAAPLSGLVVANTPPRDRDDWRKLDEQLVRKYPVQDTQIYVQVGSFSDANNAQILARKISTLGHSSITTATVNGRQFNRVRLGPLANVAEADRLLARTIAAGHPGARIIVE